MKAADNAAVARVLREMGHLLRVAGASVYKARAYERAADSILALRTPLDEWIKTGRLKGIPGIGESLARSIEEIAATGQLASHQRLKKEHSPFVAKLAELPGLGAKKSLALWQALHVESFEELERAIREGKLRGVRGFGPKLEAQILGGLAAQASAPSDRRYRLVDALAASHSLLRELRADKSVERAELSGEARRFCETVERLELLAAARDAGAVLDLFARSPDVFETLERRDETQGPSVEVQLYERDLRARLTVCAPEDFAAAWLVGTGSAGHIGALQSRARERGLSLDTQLRRGRSKLELDAEADLYRALDMSYIPPELREGQGEVEAAESDRLPEMLEPGDVLGVVHSHSTWSDGNASLEEMALAAKEAGYRYLTVTDHSPTAFYAGGLTLDSLQRQWDEIDALNEKLEGITLIKGIESDIVAEGALDYPDRILARLDVVIGSIHARHQMDESRMTQRILDAMDSPYLHILGHLTGRLILNRPAYALRTDEIFEKAAKNGIAIEVNGSPARLDMSADLARQALARGVKLVVSADSHSTREIGNMRFAVGVARKAWATRADVLNTLPAKQFISRLKRAS